MVGCAQKVPSNAEQVLDDPVNREESLGLSWRLEPAHLSLSLSRRLMRDFGSIVFINVIEMFHGRHHRTVRGSIAAKFVGDEPAWFNTLPFQ